MLNELKKQVVEIKNRLIKQVGTGRCPLQIGSASCKRIKLN
jgi:hypothetical protein